MDKLPAIELYKGAASIVDLDLTEFYFNDGTVIFTMKNVKTGEVILRKEMEEAEVHHIEFNESLTASMDTGIDSYKYDLMWSVNGHLFPQCGPSNVIVRATVGGAGNDM